MAYRIITAVIMMKIIFVVVALCLGQAAGLCSSNAGFDFSKTLNYNAIVTGYKVNVQRIVGNGLVRCDFLLVASEELFVCTHNLYFLIFIG